MKSALLASVLMLGVARGQAPSPAPPAPGGEASVNDNSADTPNRAVARISIINGVVSVRRGDSGEAVAAALNAPLTSTDRLLTGEGSRAEIQFDSTMKTAMPEATLRAVWENLLAKAGPWQKQLQARVEKQAGYDVVFVTCQFENESLDLKIVYDSQLHVSGLWILPPSLNGSAPH